MKARLSLTLALFLPGLSFLAQADDVFNARGQATVDRTECPRKLPEEPLATEYGSAGIMKNLAESADSIKAIASRLLERALTVESRKPARGCDTDCPASEAAEVVYRVAPMAFLPRTEQNQACLTFEKQTTLTPMRFEPPAFENFESLNAWISDLSQGRGDDGERLYEQCSSNCSPRYTFFIAAHEDGYAVRAEVLCGLARDRSNDQYLISTALKRSCAVN